jgi:Holliday junction resolvasome RuvABC endonuclease subunit
MEERKIGVLGLDPGLDGGIALIRLGQYKQTDFIEVHRMITKPGLKKGREVDARALLDHFQMLQSGLAVKIQLAAVEWLQFMPRKGKGDRFMSNPKTEFMLGMSYGKLVSVLECLKIPIEFVYSQTWKKAILGDRGADKNRAIRFCLDHFPRTSLLATSRCTTPHDGIADALCLAEYARRKLLNEELHGEEV